MPRALVTGARGFIGSHVVAVLDAEGIEVVTMGRSSSAGAMSIDHATLSDVNDIVAIRKMIERYSPATIFHIAGTARSEDMTELYRANVVYACSVISAARSVANPPVVVLAGSATEYLPTR